jgi:hypothetical protein
MGLQMQRSSFASTVGNRPLRIKGPGMLILTRRIGETIRIGDGVPVTALTLHGNQVQLGIKAPKSGAAPWRA